MPDDNIYGLDFNIAPKPSPKKDGDAKPAQPAPPAQKKQPNNGFGPETEKPKVPPPKEIKLLGAKFEPGQLDGFAPNKNCRVTGLAEFLCETNLTRCTLELFTIFDGKTQNTQINETKYGTANIDKNSGEFTFPTVPLYIPSGYPDYNTFSSPIKYKGVISATRHTEPLEFFIEFPDELVPKPIILKKGKFDDNGLVNHKDLCNVNSPEYCKGTAVTALQKKLIELRYLSGSHILGLFDETTEKALKKFQKDSLDTVRLSSLTKKLTNASMITFKGTVNGEYDDFTAQEIAQWQVESFLGPSVELYENDFDKEAVSQRIRTSGGDDFHEIGKPVVEAQKLLKAVGAYYGKEHGNFDKEMKNSLITFQNAAANGDLTDTNSNKVSLSKLQGHKIGIYDTPTQLFLQECIGNKWKIEQVALGVRACDGPISLKHNETGTFKVTSFTRLPTADEKKKIHWSVNINGKEVEKHENIGDIFEFHAIGKYVGETVTVHPYINKPSDNVKVTATIGNYLVYDGSKLHWYDETLKVAKSWDATTGVKGQVDPSKEDGPIPVGKWAVLYSKRDVTDKKEQKEFGAVRYELFPFTDTKDHNRKGFFIHGGKDAGTAHGIDLVDKIESFADTIEKLGKDMVLVVNHQSLNRKKSGKAIKLGDKGEIVEEINIRLAGFGGGPPSDTFDEETERKVKNFEKAYMKRKDPTGIVDVDVAAAIDEFGEKWPIDFKSLTCPCGKCDGFGNGNNKGIYKTYDKKTNKLSLATKDEKFNWYEYPGIHRSLLWSFKALLFNSSIKKQYLKIDSAYRCCKRMEQKERYTCNHIGKAIDIHIYNNINNEWIRPSEFDARQKGCDELKKMCLHDFTLNACVDWPSGIKNQFNLESAAMGATTWVHIDVRLFEENYLEDRFFCKENIKLIKRLEIR